MKTIRGMGSCVEWNEGGGGYKKFEGVVQKELG